MDTGNRVNAEFSLDTPLDSAKNDKFDRESYVSALSQALCQSGNNQGLIVGIAGPWGSGKTSLKNMIMEKISENSNDVFGTRIVEFNPWMYSGSDKIVSLLFSQISQSLSPCKEKIKHSIAKIADHAEKTSDILSDIPKSGNLKSAAKAFSAVSEALDPHNDEIDELVKRRDKLSKKLGKTNGRIIVFIDDLDRLFENEIADVLRAIKSVGDLPHMTYVLLYDRNVLTKALDATCQGLGDEYLSKIIQVPITLPDPPRSAIDEKLKNEIGERAAKSYEVTVKSLFTPKKYAACITPYILSMRDAIRLSNEFRLRYSVLQDDIEVDDLLYITSIEIFAPELHQWIRSNKNMLVSPVSYPRTFSTHDEREKQRCKELSKKLKPLSAKNVNALKALFPFVEAAIADNWSHASIAFNDSHRQICQAQHFDAYFRLSINQEMLPENVFKQFFLDDELSSDELDNEHLKIFEDTYFAGKAAKYLYEESTERITKVVEFCLQCDSVSPQIFRFTSMSCIVSILDKSERQHRFPELFESIVQTVTESSSPASLPVAASLAIQIQEELRPIFVDDSGAAQHVIIPGGDTSLSLSFHREYRELFNQCLPSLKSKLQKEISCNQPLCFFDEMLNFYMKAIVNLLSTDDELTKGFAALKSITDPNQYAIYAAASLAESRDGAYFVNVRLLQQLVNKADYQSAIESLLEKPNFWDYLPSDRCAAAAYSVIIDEQKSDEDIVSVTEEQAKTVVNQWAETFNRRNSKE